MLQTDVYEIFKVRAYLLARLQIRFSDDVDEPVDQRRHLLLNRVRLVVDESDELQILLRRRRMKQALVFFRVQYFAHPLVEELVARFSRVVRKWQE